ncbi:MAG: hypothetical protein II452_01650 [Paludibacteraceae bacterium]|nr:hypothetical protein [Paludibacteraceae bacterium]
MKNKVLLISIWAAVMLMISPYIDAKQGHDNIVWTKRPNSKNGLYTTKNYFVSNGVSLSAFGMYYFGDVDNEGVAFTGGFNLNNLSLGGGLSFSYQMPAGNHCNLRFSALGGTLRGNNELKFNSLAEPRDDYRRFSAFVIQPSFGVQCYPSTSAGFYLYAGVALGVSIINDYQFYYYKRVGSQKERTLLQGKTFGFLPMIQLGLGYSWRLTAAWSMSAELMIQEGLLDAHYLNLDGWPMAPGQNSDGAELGSSGLTYINRYGQESLHWNDGWFQIGLTVTYHWRNCETCRLNTYHRVKMRRR